MTEEGPSYNARYYSENREALLEKKRTRYQEDPEYRERILTAARERKRILSEERKKEKALNKGKEKPLWFSLEIGGEEIPVKMFTSGQLSKRLGRKSQTVRVWEKRGLIPEAIYRSAAKDRLYTEFQVNLILQAYDRAEEEFGEKAVTHRISSTSFFGAVRKIWEDYPNGIEE